MNDLKAYYRGSLKNRIETLEAVKGTLGEDNREARESIRRIAQSLKGAGVTYGFPEITRAAEALLASPRESLRDATEALIEAMHRVAKAAPEDVATILIVDDDLFTCDFLTAKLNGPNRKILTAESAAAADKILAHNEVDLILLDLLLPDEDGRDLLARIRDHPRLAMTPIVVISALEGTQPKTECYALGADEFFDKPIDLDALASAVATKLLRAGEISREARIDPLTGLLNRSGVAVAFERAQAMAERAGYPLSLALADLDGLKRINDTYGHAVGDDVLRRVAEILTETLRRSDQVARWGGDEFVVLFSDGKASGATQALEKVLQRVGENPLGVEQPLRISFSAGVTGVSKGTGLNEAVAKADELLYRAKAAGGRRILTALQRPRIHKKQVLLADPDAQTAYLIEKQLSEAELEVVWRTDGRAALKTALDSHLDLAILDAATPDLGGLEILERLRKTAAYAETPIILLATEDSEDRVLEAFDLGVDDYVIKPFSPRELRARACRLLKTVGRRV